MERRAFLASATATLPLVAGCSSPSEDTTTTTTTTPADQAASVAQQQYPDYNWSLLDQADPQTTTTIEMTQNLRFRPTIAKVSAGETVTWTNPSFPHTLVIPALDVDREVPGGEQTSLTVDQAGTYDYVCDLHPPSMLGRLIVEES